MKLGIFTKIEMSGGSEFRAAELCSAIMRYTPHQAYLLVERGDKIPDRIRDALHPKVQIRYIFGPEPDINALYEMDLILVINTDSKHFTTAEYWNGESDRHKVKVDLSKIHSMAFLFNFLVSPSRHLYNLPVKDIRIITANSKFYNEISDQDRYENVRHFPRLKLESPINPTIAAPKTISNSVRVGFHSKGMHDKWNKDIVKLVSDINATYPGVVEWIFMGMPGDMWDDFKVHPNVTIHKENAMPVREYLASLDVFTFYSSWSRSEPWARSVAEALASGCPVLATNKGGNLDQITHGNTGYLCQSHSDFCKYLGKLIDNRSTREAMGRNAKIAAKFFSSEAVINKLLLFLT